MSRPIRVLIVDDSSLVRRALTDSLARYPEIEVVGTAVDPYVARDRILELNSDVITLDIEMPRMDGLTFLKLLMRHRPLPVIIMSSLTTAGSAKAMEALQAGAVEVLAKPGGAYSVVEDSARLAEVIKAASRAKLPSVPNEAVSAQPKAGTPVAPGRPGGRKHDPRSVILLGASTGGTEALKAVLTQLSPDLPGICIVQHIPAQFSLALANRLNSLCQFEVKEAKNGDQVRPGLALLAPGGFHMVLRRRAVGYEVALNEGPRVHYQRPAVDVLFSSAVKAGVGSLAAAAVLTGMGSDGAQGLLELRQAGAATAAQNEETCVVFGMPREAIRLGAAKAVLPLSHIPHFLERHADAVALKGC
jgi:two-component system, chemotaxis family, protein-glutamate methylesterase/glutaminase